MAPPLETLPVPGIAQSPLHIALLQPAPGSQGRVSLLFRRRLTLHLGRPSPPSPEESPASRSRAGCALEPARPCCIISCSADGYAWGEAERAARSSGSSAARPGGHFLLCCRLEAADGVLRHRCQSRARVPVPGSAGDALSLGTPTMAGNR